MDGMAFTASSRHLASQMLVWRCAQGRLAALTHAGLLTSQQHSHGGQTWSMHASIRDAARDVADELGISCLAAKCAAAFCLLIQ